MHRRKTNMHNITNSDDEEALDMENDKYRKFDTGLSLLYGFLLCGSLLGIFGIIYIIDGILPTPLTVLDEAKYPDSFITERAHHDLKMLTIYGSRVTGSYENEVLAVDFLKREISFIIQQSNVNQKIEFDVQAVSGSYYINYKPFGAINAYANVQNVIAKVHSSNNSEHSLLINAHFDSVPTSPGGSDDGINCAVMLEVLRKLSKLSERPTHNIIFLFNGAEETPLQASHGFITQHIWSKEVEVVINLEAAGAGGKEILFQTGPNKPWLMKYYSRIPHPNAQAAGEEIFQSNLIPSDTDFRIFRDFGNVIGYDMAFIRSGYRYHTKYDNVSNIPKGSYQHVGDNILHLVRDLANSPELADSKGQRDGKMIFYDVLGLFIITYTETTALIINFITVVVSIIVALKAFYDFGLKISLSTIKYLGINLAAILLGWITAAIFILLLGFIIDASNSTMSWYKNPWILFGLYVVPTIACMCVSSVGLSFFDKRPLLSPDLQTQTLLQLVRLIWTAVVFIGTCLGIRATYAICIPVLFYTIIFVVIQLCSLQYSQIVWRSIYLIGSIIPTIYLQHPTITTITFFIPICGRIGSDKNPELIMGMMTYLFTVLITSFYVPFITLLRKPTLFVISLFTIGLLFLFMVFTPLGFAYSGNTDGPAPQRFWIYHTSRVFHNETGDIAKQDAGFFLFNMDRNSPNSIKNYVPELSKSESISDDCKMYLLCGLPLASPRMLSIIDLSTWIAAEKPIIHEPIGLELVSKDVTSMIIKYNFTATGPDHMGLYISPKEGMELVRLSLVKDDEIPNDLPQWNNRSIFFINYNYGKEPAGLNFFVDIRVPENWTGPTIDIAVSGKYVHSKANVRTAEYVRFLEQFPEWADLTAALGAYESWIY